MTSFIALCFATAFVIATGIILKSRLLFVVAVIDALWLGWQLARLFPDAGF